MKLTDLDPRWIEHEGRRIGFVFVSPMERTRSDGTLNPTPYYQSCFVEPTLFHIQQQAFKAMFGVPYRVQGANSAFAWSIAGGIESAQFETLTVTPSIDGSAGGLWHGFIKNGDAS